LIRFRRLRKLFGITGISQIKKDIHICYIIYQRNNT
jgi:hypothetical protein